MSLVNNLHNARFLGAYDELLFGCNPNKDQTLGMWWILTQRNVNFILMVCVV